MSLILKISEEITTGTIVYEEVTPASGKEVVLLSFHAEAVYSQNSVCAIIWKHGHATEAEEILWSVKGSGSMPFIDIIPASDVDGVRKLALICDNGESGNEIMSARLEYKEI